jgi:hypothetical protein
MRRVLFVVLGLILFFALAALASAQPRVGPPPPRDEAPTLQPGPEHVWITGYWKWTGINYEWVDGRWVKAKKGKVWVPGEWKQVGAHWAWKPGKWVKPKPPKAPKPPKPGKGKPGKNK